MIQNNGLTLDLLLGLPKIDSVGGQVATTEMRPFSELLAALTSNGVENATGSQSLFNTTIQGLGLGDQATQALFASGSRPDQQSILSEIFSAGSLDEARLGVELSPRSLHGMLTGSLNQAESAATELSVPIRSLTESAVTSDETIDPARADDLLNHLTNRTETIHTANARQMLALLNANMSPLQHRTTGLSEGTYQILSASVVGDRLELTLQPDQPNAEPIRVSLPANLLNDIAAQTTATGDPGGRTVPVRVALTQASRSESDVAGLLAKLNLKELRVESGAESDLHATRSSRIDNGTQQKIDAVTLTFRGGQAGQPFTLGVPVSRRSILSQTRPSEQTFKPVNLEGRSQNSEARPSLVPTQSGGAAKAAGPTEWPGALRLAARLISDKPEMLESRPVDLSAATQFQGEKIELADRTLASQVRFTLPDQLAQQLKPNGRSISIAIEPEHLGKATLRLSISNQVLTARLTVDSPAAKAMVEQSLDQLTNQLARAGVKVDLINVNVAGGEAHTNLFQQRQAMQFERSRQLRRPLDHSFTQTLHTTAEPPRPTMTTYVGPRGVNLFA